jgi:DNA-binding FadR family transcriptional regulator
VSIPSHEIVINWVTAQIKAGVYKPGDRLPTIAELARLTDTSQTAVKVALIVLRDRGTVRGEAGRASYVA